LEARGLSPSDVPSFRKSSRSLPAVNTPEPPVMTMQRIAGLFCAVSIASLIARYISCVSAFFFSGRRIVMTRVASSSVTMRWAVMRVPCLFACLGFAATDSGQQNRIGAVHRIGAVDHRTLQCRGLHADIFGEEPRQCDVALGIADLLAEITCGEGFLRELAAAER